MPSNVPLDKLIKVRLYRQREAKERLLRTQAFIDFCGGSPDESKLTAFIETPQGEAMAMKLDYLEPQKSPIMAWQDESEAMAGELYLRVDLSASKKSIRAVLNSLLDKYPKKKVKKTRGDALRKKITNDEIYSIVQKHGGNIQQAMYELYPETAGINPTDSFYIDNGKTKKIYDRLYKRYHKIKQKILSLSPQKPV